jgi:DNA replication and repair protein RecF
MTITRLELRDWRNYRALSIDFADGLTVVVGPNGSGKSNLVEAIHYLSLAHSWRTDEARSLIRVGAESATVSASLVEGDLNRRISVALSGKGRRIEVNGKPIKRLSELSRLVNVILFAPPDTGLFTGSPGARRGFLDVSLSKQSLDYFSLIGRFNRLLEERNAALKRSHPDLTYVGVVTGRLIEVQDSIVRYRSLYIGQINELLSGLASRLYGEKRTAKVAYRPFAPVGDSFKEVAKKLYGRSLESDLVRKCTLVGIHHEDFALLLDGKDVAQYGSQGENRLAAIMLRLAPFFLIEDPDKKPIVVLDDVYSELDSEHSSRLTALLKDLGQTFVTAAKLDIEGASYVDVASNIATRRK